MPKSQVLTIKAVYQTDNPNEYVMLFRVLTARGKYANVFVPKAWVHEPRKILTQLANIDAALPTDSKEALDLIRAAIAKEGKVPRKRLTKKTGWVDENTYVLAHKSYGLGGNQIRHLQDIQNPNATASPGSIKGWKDGVADLCRGSSYVTFGIGIALVGPTLAFYFPATGLVFNMCGRSGGGKSSTMIVTQSVVGSAAKLRGADATKAGLENLATRLSDGLVTLDDLGSAEDSSKGLQSLIKYMSYSLRDGKGKLRSDHYNNLTGQENEHWLVAAMTNSEVPISLMANGQRKAGEEVRYIDYSIPPMEEGGILDLWFDNPEGFEADPGTIIKSATVAAEQNNGACLDGLLTHLTQDVAQSKSLANLYCKRFYKLIRKDPAYESIQDRYIEAFGKVYAALRLAVRYKAVPFDAKHVRKSVMTVFAQSELVQGQDRLVVPIVGRLLDHIHSGSNCPVVPKGTEPRKNHGLWCFSRAFEGQMRVHIDPEGLAQHFGQVQAKLLENLLLSEQIQIRSPNGNPRAQVFCPWLVQGTKRPRLMVLDLKKLKRYAAERPSDPAR